MRRIRYYVYEPGDVLHQSDIIGNQHAALEKGERVTVAEVADPHIEGDIQRVVVTRANGMKHPVWVRLYYTNTLMTTHLVQGERTDGLASL